MKLSLVLTKSRHVVPASPDDREKLRAFRAGDILPVRIMKPRNGDHFRKFMALVQFVADHHPEFRDVEDVKVELKLRTGHYDHYVRRATGEVVFLPKSIAFDEMDEADFIVWSGKAKQVIFDKMLPEFTERDRARLTNELDAWYAWT